MRPALVPGRGPGGALAAVGVVLALPTLVWPVMVTSYLSPDVSDVTVPSLAQGVWSWGKFAELSEPLAGAPFGLSNTFGLVFLLLSLLVGAGAAVAWAFVGGGPGQALGSAGASFVTAAQLTLAAQWWSQRQAALDGDSTFVRVDLQPAGWLQLASVMVLLVALGFMLRRALQACLAPTWGRLNVREPEVTVVQEGSHDRAPARQPIGSAHLRQVDDAGGRSRPVEGPAVGFSDTGPERDRSKRRSGRA